MQGHSPQYADAVRHNHTGISRVRTFDENGRQLHELRATDGEVRADRTQAQMRDMDVYVPGDDLVPDDMTDELTPGTRILVERGVRHKNVDMRAQVSKSAESWQVTSGGMLFSVVVDVDGALTLGGA